MRAPMKIVVDFAHVLTDRDRHGNRRFYYRRRKGEPKIRLHGQPGTPNSNASTTQRGPLPKLRAQGWRPCRLG